LPFSQVQSQSENGAILSGFASTPAVVSLAVCTDTGAQPSPARPPLSLTLQMQPSPRDASVPLELFNAGLHRFQFPHDIRRTLIRRA